MATHRLTALSDEYIATGDGLAVASLGVGANSITTTGFDNTSLRWPFCIFELVVDWDTTGPTANGLMKIWLLPSYDGTTFSDGGSSVDPTIALAEAFPVRSVLTEQKIISPFPIQLTPVKYKILLMNDTDQAVSAAGGQSLSLKRFGYESV